MHPDTTGTQPLPQDSERGAAADSVRVAVLTPTGRDATVARRILDAAGLLAMPCEALPDLVERLASDEVGVAVVAEEALVRNDLRALVGWVDSQPPWSDFPFVVLTRQGGFGDRAAGEQQLMSLLGNVTFLERPFHPTTLVSLARSALRGRRRQYEARDRLKVVHEGQQSLALALSAGRLGAWELMLAGNVLHTSDLCKRNFGRKPEDTLTYTELLEAVHPEDLPRQQAAVRTAIEQAGDFGVSYRTFWPDGSLHWIEINGRARRDSHGVVSALVGVSADISERVRAEHEHARLLGELSAERAVLERRVLERTVELTRTNAALQAEIAAKAQAERQLREAQKIETMGQLVGGVAHDFNNLLMVVIANLELLRRRLAKDAANLRLVEGARLGAERGAQLTKRLLAFARRQDLQPESVDLAELLDGMRSLMERSIGPFIELSLAEAVEPLPPVRVDRNQLEMALLNLAVNARDAMSDGGRLIVARRSFEASPDNEHGLAPGHYVGVSVEDTGCGMDDATLARAIEPFFSTKGVGKGTGLGLSMVHGMARQSGGVFLLASQPGSGTRAELLLPVSEQVSSKPQPREISPLAAASGLVLVVDDDELVAAGTAAMLEDLGYSVTQLHSARDALTAISNGLEPQLLITDYAMPGMNGAELAKTLKTQWPTLPILIVTGYSDVMRDESFPVPKLTKPYSQQELAIEVSRLIMAAQA